MPFPSDEQRAVIEHRGRPLVVVAGAGTGKTKTIVQRMIRLLDEDPSRNITFVTFTRTSRSDTSEKLASELPTDTLENPVATLPRVGTLHASARAILHRFAGTIGHDPNFTIFIVEKGERSLIVSEAIDDLDLGFAVPFVEQAIVSMLCNLTPLETNTINEELQNRLFERYEELLRFYKAYGMEEIVYLACRALETAQQHIPPIFLQVDEYQDLNPADQYLVGLVASDDESQVVVVGDDAQSIYQFRHANYEGLRELWDSEEWEQIRFHDSFRLPAHIQRAALSLIADEDYLGGVMSIKPENGQAVRTLQCTRSEYQPIVISRCIQEFVQHGTKNDGEPVSYSDVMILCPSSNLNPGVIEELGRHGIPSRDVSRIQIPDDVWRIILIIRMAFHQDNVAFRQWLDIAEIDPEEISSIRLEAIESGLDLIEFCRQLGNEAISSILEGMNLVDDSSDDLESLIQAIAAFPYLNVEQEVIEEVVEIILHEGQLPPESQFLRSLYRSYGVLEDEGQAGDEDAVLVSSLHSSKGLEGELVCLMWMNERFMPMPGRNPQEERRLLYVAMTRARQDLIITFHEVYDRQVGYRRIKAMSPFLREIADYLNIERIRAADIR